MGVPWRGNSAYAACRNKEQRNRYSSEFPSARRISLAAHERRTLPEAEKLLVMVSSLPSKREHFKGRKLRHRKRSSEPLSLDISNKTAVFQHDCVQTYSKSGADKADIDGKINLLGLEGQALPPLCHEIGTIMSTCATEMQETFMWVRDAARHGRKKL
ncbi:hypothetical protein Naga_100473g2 [Nannochloropsis gaditana]|uniref:Uncharacterized protein n=1 Tax=Nannochloropsis gaditana TaxID=72520 RepID=W7TGN2_9STRA|nr:hypothetical protein Naga_100473g2 [Nannochloropsis gaditana]